MFDELNKEDLVELIEAKNAEIQKLKKELEDSKKETDNQDIDKEAEELLKRLMAK